MKRLAQSFSFKGSSSSSKNDKPGGSQAAAGRREAIASPQGAASPPSCAASPSIGTGPLTSMHSSSLQATMTPDTNNHASVRPGSSGKGGTLRDYQVQVEQSEAQRAAYARQHGTQCAVCQQPFSHSGPRAPRIAPCLHTICHQCICSLPGQACPLDRTPVPQQTVMTLPINWIILGSIDLANLQAGRSRQCDLCDDESAESVSTSHCSQCNFHLCELHSTAHKRSRETKLHVLRPFQNYVAALQQEHPSGLRVARNLKPLMCAETGHQDQRVDVWCAVCEVMVCVQCALLQHRDHYIGTWALFAV